MKNTKNIIKYKVILTIFVGFLSTFSFVGASTNVFFTQNNKIINKGDTFIIDLKISSDKPINAIDGTVIFDNKKILVKDVKTINSIFSIWAKSPSFDNKKGTVDFIGGVPGGFSGNDGQVIKITFKAINGGDTRIDFQDIFSVYLNDGLGTRVNVWMEPSTLYVGTTASESLILKTLQNLINKYVLSSVILIVLMLLVIFQIKKNIITKKRA